MNFIFCVFFLCVVTGPDWAGPQGLGGQDLSDDDIIEALALLLSETEDGQDRRRGRQEFAGGQERPVFNLELDDLELDRASAGRQLSRQDFEDVLGKCTTTGYEVRFVVTFLLKKHFAWLILYSTLVTREVGSDMISKHKLDLQVLNNIICIHKCIFA